MRFVSRSRPNRRGDSENISKRTVFQTRRESLFWAHRAVEKAVRRNGHLAIQSLVRTVIGSDLFTMMLTQENTMEEEKLWDL